MFFSLFMFDTTTKTAANKDAELKKLQFEWIFSKKKKKNSENFLSTHQGSTYRIFSLWAKIASSMFRSVINW